MGIESFHEIFRNLDRELWLITARDGELRSGLIATYVSKVSLVPLLPRVTVALATHHFTHELIVASGAFCMHLLSENQLDLVWRFGLASGRNTDKLAGLDTTTTSAGTPVLRDAIGWLDCRVEATLDTGDRTVFLAEVVDTGMSRYEKPLTFNRMLTLAPSEKLQELKSAMEHDIEIDHKTILSWRERHVPWE